MPRRAIRSAFLAIGGREPTLLRGKKDRGTVRAIAERSRGLRHERRGDRHPSSDPSVTPSGPEKAYVRFCEACSRPFELARKRRRFCSPRCRARDHRKSKQPDPRLAGFLAAIQAHLESGRMATASLALVRSRWILCGRSESSSKMSPRARSSSIAGLRESPRHLSRRVFPLRGPAPRVAR
jgi:hypothetical protein